MRVFLFLSLLITCLSQGVKAQGFNTGDANLDASLKNFNIHSKTDISLFKRNISVDFGLSEGRIDHLMISYKMEPAELLLVLETSRHCSRPVEKVIECYEGNKDRGWGVIAKEMGIKPGSPEFHAMKKDLKYKCGKKEKRKGNDDEDGNHQGRRGRGNGKGKGKHKR